jgi:flagellum-specific peptidoglycan hydrolase FlgJ
MAEFKQLNRKQYNALSAGQKKEFKKAYIAHHLPMFKKHCEGTGLNPEMLLAQTAKESQYGISGLSYADFNYGGQKYYGDTSDPANANNFAKYNTNEEFKTKAEADAYKKKQEAKGLTTKHVKKLKAKDGTYYYQWRGQQPFKKFATAEEGVRAQVEFFSKSPRRYKDVGKLEDPYDQIEAIKNAGYATDSTGTYVSDIIEIYDDITLEDGEYYNSDIELSPSTLKKVGVTQEEKDQIAIDIKPTPAPLPEDMPIVLSQIEVDRENARRRQEEEKKKKEEVYQPKELVPLSDLTEEEINNLTDEERKGYGLQPTVDVVGGKKTDDELTPEQIAQIEKERLLAEKEEAEENKYSQEQLQKEKENQEKKRKQKKAENKVIDKDGDGIPDTIDADAGEPVPENQLTVSTEEQVVIDEQEKEETVETVETEEIEVLDANGNIKKITVPTVKTPTTPTTVDAGGVATEEVTTPSGVVEEKPELVKPKIKDFKTSSDYMKARMKYFKSIEEQGGENTVDFDNELDDDEIKEAVDMEQNSTVIDASKRNIFKTSGKSNIFNSIIGDIDDLAKGIQQELNNITKSINNRD